MDKLADVTIRRAAAPRSDCPLVGLRLRGSVKLWASSVSTQTKGRRPQGLAPIGSEPHPAPPRALRPHDGQGETGAPGQ